MKRFRLLHFAVLLFLAGVIVGVQFHSHAPGQDLLTAHCKSCHVSQAVYDFVNVDILSICEVAVSYQVAAIIVTSDLTYADARLSRAPPIC